MKPVITPHTIGTLAVAGVLAAVALFGSGCASRQDHTGLLRGIATSEMRLQPRNTRAPELALRVPAGYGLDWTQNAKYDAFIVYDPADNGEIQRGMLVVNITPAPVRHIPDSLTVGHIRSTLAGQTIEWRVGAPETSGIQIYRREAIVRGLFPFYKDQTSGRDLALQVFVVGTDSVLVERLMGSAETIVEKGGKPDA